MDSLSPHEIKEALVGNIVLANLSDDTPMLPEADKLADIQTGRMISPVDAFLSASNPSDDAPIKHSDIRVVPL